MLSAESKARAGDRKASSYRLPDSTRSSGSLFFFICLIRILISSRRSWEEQSPKACKSFQRSWYRSFAATWWSSTLHACVVWRAFDFMNPCIEVRRLRATRCLPSFLTAPVISFERRENPHSKIQIEASSCYCLNFWLHTALCWSSYLDLTTGNVYQVAFREEGLGPNRPEPLWALLTDICKETRLTCVMSATVVCSWWQELHRDSVDHPWWSGRKIVPIFLVFLLVWGLPVSSWIYLFVDIFAGTHPLSREAFSHTLLSGSYIPGRENQLTLLRRFGVFVLFGLSSPHPNLSKFYLKNVFLPVSICTN